MHLSNGSEVSDDAENLIDLKENDKNGSTRKKVFYAKDI